MFTARLFYTVGGMPESADLQLHDCKEANEVAYVIESMVKSKQFIRVGTSMIATKSIDKVKILRTREDDEDDSNCDHI